MESHLPSPYIERLSSTITQVDFTSYAELVLCVIALILSLWLAFRRKETRYWMLFYACLFFMIKYAAMFAITGRHFLANSFGSSLLEMIPHIPAFGFAMLCLFIVLSFRSKP